MTKKLFLVTVIFCVFLISTVLCFASCNTKDADGVYQPTNESENKNDENEDSGEDTKLSYEQISQKRAKELMETEENYVIIDARTQSEYDEGHIAGAILIPEYEIAERAEDEIPDKNQLILVYCRSGRRSKIAAAALAELGYTNVKEFGGIIDWQYGTVK